MPFSFLIFPETESGTGTAGTVFQEPKPEPEPSFPVKLYWNTVVNFTLPGLRFHTLQTRAFSSLAFSHPCAPPFLARPRPFLARPRPFLARSSPVPRPALVSSNLAVKMGKREIYWNTEKTFLVEEPPEPKPEPLEPFHPRTVTEPNRTGSSLLLVIHKASHGIHMGIQHPSPNVKNLCTFELQIWLEIITSRDAKSTCFKGSQTSCTEIFSGVFWPKFGRKRPHHVMDADCWSYPSFRNSYAINSSENIPRNDYANFVQSSQKWFFRDILAQGQNGHCANLLLEACYKNSKKAESNNKIAQSARKQFPKSYFAQSIATILHNPSENDSSIIFSRAQCFLNGGMHAWAPSLLGRHFAISH